MTTPLPSRHACRCMQAVASVPCFDPLRYLEDDLHCQVVLNNALSGAFHLEFGQGQGLEQMMQAHGIANCYRGLLTLQLQEGRASVQKLLEQGKIHCPRNPSIWRSDLGDAPGGEALASSRRR